MDCKHLAAYLKNFQFDQDIVDNVVKFVQTNTGSCSKDICEAVEDLHCNLGCTFSVDANHSSGTVQFTITDSNLRNFTGEISWKNSNAFVNLRVQLARVLDILVAYNFELFADSQYDHIYRETLQKHVYSHSGKYGYPKCVCGDDLDKCANTLDTINFRYQAFNIATLEGFSTGNTDEFKKQKCWQRLQKPRKRLLKGAVPQKLDLQTIISQDYPERLPPHLDIQTEVRSLDEVQTEVVPLLEVVTLK